MRERGAGGSPLQPPKWIASSAQRQRGVDAAGLGRHRAIAEDHVLQQFRRQHRGRALLERGLETRQIGQAEAQARGHRMPAEFLDQSGMLRIHRGQRIADVETGDRSRGTAQALAAGIAGRERDRRAMHAFLDLRRDQADDAGVPVFAIQAHRRTAAVEIERQRRDRGLGIADHLLLHAATLGVDAVEDFGEFARPAFSRKAANHTCASAASTKPGP